MTLSRALLIVLTVTALNAPAIGQNGNPFVKYLTYHLIVAFDRGGATVLDYPNKDRCEQAKAAVDADFAKRLDRARALMPPGSLAAGSPFHFEAVCVPG